MSGLLCNLIPGPFGNILAGPFEIVANSQALKDPRFVMSNHAPSLSPVDVTMPPAKKMVAAMLRTALVAAAVLAILYAKASVVLTWSSAAMSLTAVAISLPSTLAAGGAYLVYNNVPSIVNMIATKTYTTLGTQLSLLAAGWVALRVHDMFPMGLAETLVIEPVSEAYAPSIVKTFT